MQAYRYLSFALVVGFVAFVYAPPADASRPRGGVTLFAAGDYRGASETFYGDVPSLRGTIVGNDHASSLRLAQGCVVTLFEHSEYRGRSEVLRYDSPNLTRTEVGNDSVSSLRVYCSSGSGNDVDWRDRPGVALYAGGDFEGRREIFYYDDDNLSNNRIGNDTTSSVRVAPGCRVILYAGGDFSGRSVELTYDARDLRTTSVGNDTVSSVSVDCDRRGRRGRRDYDRRDRRDTDRNAPPGRWRNPYGDDRGGHPGRGGYDDHGGVTLYRGGDFKDGYETFFGDVPNLGRTTVGNDEVSSVRVSPGCRVVLYRDANYRGETTVLTYDDPNLRGSSVGNDGASSIEVDCPRRR